VSQLITDAQRIEMEIQEFNKQRQDRGKIDQHTLYL